MGIAISILTSLGVDYTVFIQLTIFVLFFSAMSYLCLREMGKILAKRRDLGIRPLSSTQQWRQNEILRLNQEYDRQVNQLYSQTQKKLQQQKQEIEKGLLQEFTQKVNELNQERRSKIQVMKEQISTLREGMQKEKRSLIVPLLGKFK